MRVIATLLSHESDAEPVQQPYTMPDANGIQALHAVVTLIEEMTVNPSKYYSIIKIEVVP